MATNVFADALKTGAPRSADLPGLDLLVQFCQGVETFVGSSIDCGAFPSRQTNYGQEYKVILTYHPSSYSSTLLRAYLNVQGEPHIDTYDGQSVRPCVTVDGLRTELLTFLSLASTRDLLLAFKDVQ